MLFAFCVLNFSRFAWIGAKPVFIIYQRFLSLRTFAGHAQQTNKLNAMSKCECCLLSGCLFVELIQVETQTKLFLYDKMVLTRSQKKASQKKARQKRALRTSLYRHLATAEHRRVRRYHHTRRAHAKNPYSRRQLSKKIPVLREHASRARKVGKYCPGGIFNPRNFRCEFVDMGELFDYTQSRYVQVQGPTCIVKLVGKPGGMWPNKIFYIIGDMHVLNATCSRTNIPIIGFKRLLHDTLVQAANDGTKIDVLSERSHESYHYKEIRRKYLPSYVIPFEDPHAVSLFLDDCDPGKTEHAMDMLSLDFDHFCRYGDNITHHSIDPREYEHVYLMQQRLIPFIKKAFHSSENSFVQTFMEMGALYESILTEFSEVYNINAQSQGIPKEFIGKLRHGVWKNGCVEKTRDVFVILRQQRQASATLDEHYLNLILSWLFASVLDVFLIFRLFRTFSYREPIQNAIILTGCSHSEVIEQTLVDTGEFEIAYSTIQDAANTQCPLVDTTQLPLPLRFDHKPLSS